ncbi:MAG TPA: hypothetical protein VG820_05015 [Fimbriimonadaceae bacterium]|nr:hypothetical protein [Fimbriimonadaceae bacterium]
MSPLIAFVAILGQGAPQIGYFLKTEPFPNEPGARLRSDNSTVYTLYKTFGNSSMEMWRITLPEKPIHTWVSGRGDVWVLADTTSPFGGPIGGRSALWARQNDASLIGSWYGGLLLSGVVDKVFDGIAAHCDFDHSGITSIGAGGNEQFRLALKNGAQIFITNVQTNDQGMMNVVQRFAKGQADDDALQQLLAKSHGPVEVAKPMPGSLPVRVWRDPSSSGRSVLEAYDQNSNGPSDFVTSDRWIAAPPTYVARTPLGRYAWFEFTSTSGTLRFLNFSGKEFQSVDLVRLGKFASATEAESQLNYRSLRAKQTYSANGSAEETFTMTDESGRKYSILLKPTGDGTVAVTTAVSLGLDRIAKKEPDYPDANLQSQTVRRSDDGRFQLMARRYRQAGRTFTQLTLSAKIDDPIEGTKEVQVWSEPSPLEPLQLRLSDSGRVYGIMLMPKPPKLAKPDAGEYAMLFCWDVDGKLSAGYNLAGLALKWFPSDAAAIKEMDLTKFQFSLAGEAAERDIDGIPLTTWPKERLDYRFANGQTQTLFVSTQQGFGMPIFTRGASH